MTDPVARVYQQMLVLRCQAGHEAALTELIARYSPGVRFYLRKMIRRDGASVADDLLQEVWFDVYRKINTLQRPEAFAAWLYRIARDKAYRQLRHQPRYAEDSFDAELSETCAAPEPDFSAE